MGSYHPLDQGTMRRRWEPRPHAAIAFDPNFIWFYSVTHCLFIFPPFKKFFFFFSITTEPVVPSNLPGKQRKKRTVKEISSGIASLMQRKRGHFFCPSSFIYFVWEYLFCLSQRTIGGLGRKNKNDWRWVCFAFIDSVAVFAAACFWQLPVTSYL